MCRPQRIYFTDCSRTLVVGCEDGFVRRYDVETGKCILEAQVHDGELTDLAMSADGTHMASSSKDKTGKLLDVQTLEVLHTYQHERPINAIALNPVQEHVRPQTHPQIYQNCFRLYGYGKKNPIFAPLWWP